MTVILENTRLTPTPKPVRFLELEITQNCQLTCPSLCYAQAGPTRSHGAMTDDDWRSVITQAAALGVKTVQFIGGEFSRRPGWDALVRHALDQGLQAQLYSNLFQIRAEWWELFEHPGVSLACSYYSDQADQHDQVTGRKGSHTKTRSNIVESVRRGIALQVGIVEVVEGQRVEQARMDLQALGVTRINMDRARGVGNAARTKALPSVSELCGNCAHGRAAVMPDGQVTPCVLGRFLPSGSVRQTPLSEILAGDRWREIAAIIPPRGNACPPDDSGDCDPANQDACLPSYP